MAATATLNYYLPPSQGGTTSYISGVVGEKRREFLPVKVNIRDIREATESFKIDTHGFELAQQETKEKRFEDDAAIKEGYYPEVVELVKKVTGATKVTPYNHVIRRQSHEEVLELEKDLDDLAKAKAPGTANFVHVDQSYNGAVQRLSYKFPDADLKTHRWGVINVWRPISHPVTRTALTMGDARSIPDDDLVEVMVSFPSTKTDARDEKNVMPKGGVDPLQSSSPFGIWQVREPPPGREHDWYYASEMQPNEVLLLKIFDTKKSGVARRSPHTSFKCARDHGPARQSIETRCLVEWEDQSFD